MKPFIDLRIKIKIKIIHPKSHSIIPQLNIIIPYYSGILLMIGAHLFIYFQLKTLITNC